MEGARFEHRKIFPYIKEFEGGDSPWVVPPMRSTTHVVRSGKVFARIYALLGRMGFISASQQATTFLIAGPDPFAASADFSMRFRRSSLPTAIGGALIMGGVSVARDRLRELDPR